MLTSMTTTSGLSLRASWRACQLNPDVEIGRSCRIHKAVIDSGCRIPEGTVIGEDPGGEVMFNRTLVDLATHFGFSPRACKPYRAKTKGKVERSIDYIANSFFHPLVTRLALEQRVPSLEELNAEARHWCATVANVRIHGTTGEQPSVRLAAEQAAMQPYVAEPAAGQVLQRQWPRYPLQRSPKDYDAVLQEVG